MKVFYLVLVAILALIQAQERERNQPSAEFLKAACGDPKRRETFATFCNKHLDPPAPSYHSKNPPTPKKPAPAPTPKHHKCANVSDKCHGDYDCCTGLKCRKTKNKAQQVCYNPCVPKDGLCDSDYDCCDDKHVCANKKFTTPQCKYDPKTKKEVCKNVEVFKKVCMPPPCKRFEEDCKDSLECCDKAHVCREKKYTTPECYIDKKTKKKVCRDKVVSRHVCLPKPCVPQYGDCSQNGHCCEGTCTAVETCTPCHGKKCRPSCKTEKKCLVFKGGKKH